MVEFLLGGSGTGKSEELVSRIKKASEQGGKCLVIIPDQFSFEYDKKLYHALGAKGYNSLSVLSFGRLASDIFMHFGGRKGSFASDSAKLALTYLAVKNIREKEGFEYFDRQSRSSSFVGKVSAEIKELHYAGISADELLEAGTKCGGRQLSKAKDICAVYTEYERLLSEKNLKDSISDVEYASVVAYNNSYFEGTDIFIDEFQTFPADQMNMIRSMISCAKSVTICLTTENTSSRLPLFSAVNSSFERISKIAKEQGIEVRKTYFKEPLRFKSKDIAGLSGKVFRNEKAEPFSSQNIKTVSSSDVYKECDFVASEIKRLVEGGMKYRDIAVLARNTADYGSIIEGAFERYDIPVFMDMQKAVMHKSVMLMILSALEYASTKKISTETVLRYIKTGIMGISPEDAGTLDNFVYRYGIDGELWTEEFPLTKNENEKEQRDTAEELRAKVIPLLEEFKGKCKNASGKEICRALFELICKNGAYDYLSAERSLDTESLEIIREQKQVWNAVTAILDELYTIIGDEKISAEDFGGLFSCIASGESIATPPQTLDAVVFSGTERARLSSPRAVFIIGATEGAFPALSSENGLFDIRDIRALAKAGAELDINSKFRMSEEIFFAYKALSAPSEKLYVSYPYLNASGDGLYPSAVIKNITDMTKDDIHINADKLGALYFARTKKSAFYGFVCEFDKDSEDFAVLREYLKSDEEYKGKVDFLEKTVFEKVESLEPQTALSLFGKRLYISPSRFEDYQNCPFVYFCKKGLELYPVDKIEFNPSYVGSIVHHCLCRTLENMTRDEFLSCPEEKLKEKISSAFDEFLSEQMGGEYAKSASFRLSGEGVKKSTLEIILHLKEEFSQSGFYPFAFEKSISDDKDGISPRVIKSENGIEIHFSGTVDRADIFKDGDKNYIRVVDYKTGDKTFSLGDIYHGKNIQMLVYLYSIVESMGKSVPAGVLYMPSHDAEPELSRDASADEAKKLCDKNYKMKGVVLDDERVIHAMEDDIGGKYIPVALKNDGSYTASSMLMTGDEFSVMKDYIDYIVGDMADSLTSGKIEASPLVSGQSSPCNYCDYWSVCLKSSNPPVREYKPSQSAAVMKEILQKGGIK